MKKLILKITFLLLLSGNMYGQSPSDANELVVDSIPQRARRFCWAATMQMIMKFQGVNKSQCELDYDGYLKSVLPSGQWAQLRATCLLLCSGDCVAERTPRNPCDQALPFRSTVADNSKFEKMFNTFGFNSTEKMNRGGDALSYETIKKQIDNRQPMAIVFRVSGSGMVGAHFTVLKGYKREINQDTFICIFDPWRPCIGGTVLVNFAVVRGNAQGTYTGIETYTQDIIKRQQIVPMMAMSVILDTTTLTKNSESLYAHGITKAIKPAEFDALKVKIPVKYVKPTDLSYLVNGSGDSCGRNNPVFDVSKPNDSSSVITTLQFVPTQEKWIPIEIKRYPYPTNLRVKVGNEIITLNNQNNQCFEHIIINDTHFEFYRFVYRGKPYLLPIEQTADLLINNRNVFQYTVYTAASMAAALKKAIDKDAQILTIR